MYISNTGHYTVTECNFCYKLFVVKNKQEGYGEIDKIHDLYTNHLEKTPRCKQYHDNCPKLSDLKGIAPDITGGLSPEEFVRKQREEW